MITELMSEIPTQASTTPLVWGAVLLVFIVLAAVLTSIRNQNRRF